MTSVSLPDPVVRRTGPPRVDARALERALRERTGGEVRFDAGSRGAYSTDASNYRQVPIGVVVPRTVDDAVQDVQRLREQTVTLAELLRDHTDGWQPPHLGGKAIAQTHCHQHAIMGYDADQALLRAAGVDLDVLDAGCCGLAGNFGFEAGHYDVSRACGERVLLPAVRDAAPGTWVLADGFSCRTQIEQGGTGRTPVHLAEILAAGLRGASQDGQPVPLSRPAAPGAADYARLAAVAAGVAGLGAGLGAMARRRRSRG
jgi:hypothetical protein